MGKPRMLYIRKFYVVQNTYINLTIFIGGTQGSTPADEMNACLKNSNLWVHVKTLKLTTNMRVRLQNDDSGQTFSDQLLAIGNGKLPVDSIPGQIQLPAEFCNLVTSKNELIEKVFPNILNNIKNNKWLSERAILAPKKYRCPRNYQYCFDQDSRPGSPLQVSRHSFGTK